MASRWARAIRGTLAALFATGAAAVSHALAGGTNSVIGIVVAMAFATLVSVALTGRRLSILRLAASVALSQLAFHTLFSLFSDTATVVPHGHHSYLVTDAAAASHLASSMWLGHAVAALLTLVVLHYAERAFWRLGDLLFVRLRLRFVLDAPATPLLASFSDVAILRSLRERSSQLYRGPPVASVA